MAEFRPPEISIAPGPYRSSGQHLRDELARMDLLVRAQVVRWRLTIGDCKPETLWGMAHVSDEEVRRYLESKVQPLDTLPGCLLHVLCPYWRAAEEAAQQIKAAVENTPCEVELRLSLLRSIFCLSELQTDVLLLCLLPECDSRYYRLFGYLQDDVSRARPPLDLLVQILRPQANPLEEARALLEPGSVLLAKHLLVVGSTDEMRPRWSIRLEDRIASWLLGLDTPDTRLLGILSEDDTSVSWEHLFIPESLEQQLRRLGAFLGNGASRRCATTVLLHGPNGSGRWKAAQAVCAGEQKPLLRVSVEAALRDPARWELMVDLSYREAALRRAAIYWAGIERLFQDEGSAFRWDYLLRATEEAPGVSFLAVTSPSEAAAHFRDSHLLRIDFPVPSYEMRKQIWRAYLPDLCPSATQCDLPETLAGSFQLTEGQIHESLAAARTLAQRRDVAEPRITQDDLLQACRRQSGKRLVSFARRIEPRPNLTLQDVILPEPNKRQLIELRNRISLRNRVFSEMGLDRMTLGRGLLALFVGPSGTGKTMSAELLASEQQIDLYKVDLSAVVSKWVGETEKNLNRIFSDAEDSNAMLFFDECDALFGQRGEIREAKDRWANLEVNYLLQRVEEYAGVVIMATNLRQNIDDAFMRRIQVVVEFPAPASDLRFSIWKRNLPAAPRSAVSDDELHALSQRFPISGGVIRNVVIDAAFRALVATPAEINLRHLVLATAREYQKLGRPITRGDFGEPFFDWIVTDILAPTNAA